ncbi:MAG: GNAT family N-acetyltransferase [Bacteroidales bacterium]|nr:GNAT family N-acetyltransferase [Bacteroidales bacterium]
MIVFKQTNEVLYREAIVSLYIDCFATGVSEQYIDLAELTGYIGLIFEKGNAILSFEDEIMTGAVLSLPLKYDSSLPEIISRDFAVDNCIYIAELMVAEQKRGKGIGEKLLSEFIKNVDRSLYADIFIRVWDQNFPALRLYEKMGFVPVTTIRQTKKHADGNGTFDMNKIYLHKPV